MVKHTSGFMGNNAFDQARAFVVESANKMLEIRRPGSIKAASEAIQHAKAADAVKQCGKKDLLVRITLDHSDFEKLEVRCGREKIFEEDRGAAMAGRNRSGRVARSSTKATGSAHRAGADKKKSTQAGKALRGAGTIRTKVFLGNNAFNDARDLVEQQAQTMVATRRPGSIKAADMAIKHAQKADAVKQCGKASWRVRITLDHGDFEKLEVFCGPAEKRFEEHRFPPEAGSNRSGKTVKSTTRAGGSRSGKTVKSTTRPAGSGKPAPAAKKKPAPVVKAPVPNLSIDNYIAGLNYDPQILLSVVPDGTTSSLPVKDRQAVGNVVIICTKIQHTLKKNLSEVAILSPAAGVIFPGALVHADQAMMEGHPTPITLPRARVTLSVDLPGLKNPSGTVTPNSSGVPKFLNTMLEEWNQIPVSQGYVNAARSILQISKAYSSQQVSLELGFNAQWASGSASVQVGVASTTEKSVMVAYYKQVFYTITMDTPATPASVFSKAVSLKQVQQAFDNAHPPAYVRSIDYGRILMVKMESSKVDTSVDLKAAFQQGAFGGSLDAKYKEVIENSTFTVLAIGGGAETPAKMFNGASDANLKELQAYIATDATYRRNNPGLPIAYTIVFLKDNSLARMGNTADYTETECVRFNNGFVRVVHAGGYVAKFEVNWVEPDAVGNYTVAKQWESGEKTAGYSEQIDLPGDAKGVRIEAWAMTGLVWDPWGEIMNIALDGPDNKTYRATGTTLGRSWDNG